MTLRMKHGLIGDMDDDDDKGMDTGSKPVHVVASSNNIDLLQKGIVFLVSSLGLMICSFLNRRQ